MVATRTGARRSVTPVRGLAFWWAGTRPVEGEPAGCGTCSVVAASSREQLLLDAQRDGHDR